LNAAAAIGKWNRWGKGEGDWARRRSTKLGRNIEDEVGVCEG